MSEPKKPITLTKDATPPPGQTTQSAAAKVQHDRLIAKHYRNVAQQQAGLDRMSSNAMSKKRWLENVKNMQAKDPQLLNYLKEKFPKQVAEAELALAKKAGSTPKVGPRIGSPKIGGFKAGFKASLAGAFSPVNLVAIAAEIILAVADREAAKEAIRNIQTKYLREGFARGFAAGVMGWSDAEVQMNLKYHVRSENLQTMHDPGGILTRSDMFRLAEACDNYAVDVGFDYSSKRPNDWKLSMLKKGFSLLVERGRTKWQNTDDPSVLFELEFIDDLAWVLRPTADTLVTIRFQ